MVGLIMEIYRLRGFLNGMASQGKKLSIQCQQHLVCHQQLANQLLSSGNYNPPLISYVEKNKPPTLLSQLVFAFTGRNTFINHPKEFKKPSMTLV